MADTFGNFVLSCGFGMVSKAAAQLIRTHLRGRRVSRRDVLRVVLSLIRNGELRAFHIGHHLCLEEVAS